MKIIRCCAYVALTFSVTPNNSQCPREASIFTSWWGITCFNFSVQAFGFWLLNLILWSLCNFFYCLLLGFEYLRDLILQSEGGKIQIHILAMLWFQAFYRPPTGSDENATKKTKHEIQYWLGFISDMNLWTNTTYLFIIVDWVFSLFLLYFIYWLT